MRRGPGALGDPVEGPACVRAVEGVRVSEEAHLKPLGLWAGLLLTTRHQRRGEGGAGEAPPPQRDLL